MLIKGQSVTQRIKSIKQPYGGYVRASRFETTELDDGRVLNPTENIHPSLVGMAVDYLTRLMNGTFSADAFQISLLGAQIASNYTSDEKYLSEALFLLNQIHGLDDTSIISACKLVSYDVWLRNTSETALQSKGADDVHPDQATIENIRLLVERTINYFNEDNPITTDGFTFEPHGYTELVVAGDGDFLTENTLWDLKVRKSKIDSKTSLQLMMYYLMGKRSGQDIFDSIQRIGIFNPRLHIVQTLDVSDVSSDVIETIEKEVIGYK